MLIGGRREPVFDELTKAAAQLLGAPFAFMTAVDDSQSYWKSTYGIEDGTRSNSVGDSFCQYVIDGNDDLIVDDATADPITMDNPSIKSMGVMAWAGCPVRLDGEVLGTFCVVDQRVRTWTEDDRDVLRSLAMIASREIAIGVELRSAIKARREAETETDRVRELLDTIRLSLMPPVPPEIPGLDMAVWYAPASGTDQLLGDFYDAFPLSDGVWGLVIGDVCGHGVAAAKLTAFVRYTIRSAAVHHRDPAAVLAEVDRAIYRDDLDDGRFATACYYRIDTTAAEGVEVQFARAGHTLPIVIADGEARLVEGGGGPPLGVLRKPGVYARESFHLAAGDRLVTYTDGVTECRDETTDVMLGERQLLEILAAAASTSNGATELLHEAMRTLHSGTSPRMDDTIILVVQA
jgi:serine phosphatase RsbU (regulator of sigma subunit)